LSDVFLNVKKYDYPEYKPPNITIEDYFNVEKWQQYIDNKKKKNSNTANTDGNNDYYYYYENDDNNKDNTNNSSNTAVNETFDELQKDTFIVNPAPTHQTQRTFKLNLAMCDNFGLTVNEIIAILEAAAPRSKLALKLKEFLQIKMPPGFPIELELPLFHVLKAIVTFQNFQYMTIPNDIFAIPNDYRLVEKDNNSNFIM